MQRVHTLALAMLLALPMTALAGKQEAELALTAARSNVAAAERAEAARHATIELKAARDLLARAEGSFDQRDWTDAEREAERAKADARLAETRARQRIAESQLAELERSIQTLREEIARNGGRS
jgi:TATA-binding protein-associated factor Taf7